MVVVDSATQTSNPSTQPSNVRISSGEVTTEGSVEEHVGDQTASARANDVDRGDAIIDAGLHPTGGEADSARVLANDTAIADSPAGKPEDSNAEDTARTRTMSTDKQEAAPATPADILVQRRAMARDQKDKADTLNKDTAQLDKDIAELEALWKDQQKI